MEKKFTLIDTKTQIVSWILLIVGGYVVAVVLIGLLFDINYSGLCCIMIFIV